MAAKPHDFIELSNGCPGCPHFNLNIHGKETSTEATDIIDLFKWTGWVFNVILDTSGDGIIDESDVPLTYELKENGGNGNGVIGNIEFKNWLSDSEYVGLATYYENEWILNIADLVLNKQAIVNDGRKLLRLHFYPVETTVYE